MENKFKIAKYEKQGESFIKVGYDEYSVRYIKGLKVHQLRITVDGYLTKQKINLMDGNSGYKSKILSAIKEYIEFGHQDKNRCTKFLKNGYIENLYSKKIVHNIKTFLLNIRKEDSRDVLTQYGLFKNV